MTSVFVSKRMPLPLPAHLVAPRARLAKCTQTDVLTTGSLFLTSTLLPDRVGGSPSTTFVFFYSFPRTLPRPRLSRINGIFLSRVPPRSFISLFPLPDALYTSLFLFPPRKERFSPSLFGVFRYRLTGGAMINVFRKVFFFCHFPPIVKSSPPSPTCFPLV